MTQPQPHVVRIADLRKAAERALLLAEELLGPEVELGGDFYWHLPVEEAFDMTNEPRTLTVGQLSDDIGEAVVGDHEPMAGEAWHNLQHLIGLLRALELAATP